MKTKIRSWIIRYLPAEILAIIGALIGGILINFLTHNGVLTALGGTWGENIGYYGTILVRDFKKLKEKYKKITLVIVFRAVRNLLLEFGPAEYLDSFLIRPFAMYFFPKFLNNLPAGLIIGKFSADFIFYIPTIISFELRNKLLKE